MPWMIWIVMGFSTFLRLSVQLANLVFAYSLGVLWKNRKKPAPQSEKPVTFEPSKSNLQIKQEKIIRYLERNGGKANRLQILSSRLCKGGAMEYDRILAGLEKSGRIKVEREKASKQEWFYSVL
jgi:hypothetical protein